MTSGTDSVMPDTTASITTPTDKWPHAPAVKVTLHPDTRTVLVACPFCGKKHTHGWPYGSDRAGYRGSHCTGRGGEHRGGTYLITGEHDAPTRRAKP